MREKTRDMWSTWFIALALVAMCAPVFLLLACRSDSRAKDEQYYEHILPFDTATVRVASATDTTRLTVLLAESEEQRTLGLMERRSLAPNAGMLFLYSATQPPTPGYWTFRTRIPLDIAFAGRPGTHRMDPDDAAVHERAGARVSRLPGRRAVSSRTRGQRGLLRAHRSRVGDQLFLGDTTARRRGATGNS